VTSSADLVRWLERFPRFRVAVVGDLMLDRYVWGSAARISQEAPVPVVRVERETHVAGGAANVARNVLSLGGKAVVFGVTGQDRFGRDLCQVLRRLGGDTSHVVRLDDRPTTTKTRVLAGTQQVVRIDSEDTSPVPAHVLDAVSGELRRQIEGGEVHGVVFEDYAKGMMTAEFMAEIAATARRCGVPVALDPHPSHPFNVHGLTVMTPNRAEAFGLAGVYYQPGVLPIVDDEPLRHVARRLQRLWGTEICLITLGAHGMALCVGRRPVVHIPTVAREVFDVSGAGDTVIATYTMSLLAGASPYDAGVIANHAAGIVVGKVGTAAVEIDELCDSLRTA
jgi:D-beta-D-heptose 7-phosphate kinase/D-beta-D-heptose 1-phosphate adenosyltransferase